MKITVTKEETIEKATPFFTRDFDNTYYAFYSDKHTMTVCDYSEFPFIGNRAPANKAQLPEITAKEFEAIFSKVHGRLADEFEQGRDKVRESKGLTTDNFQVTE